MLPYIYNWDVTDLLEDLANPNRDMIDRDGEPTEQPQDPRGEPFKRANKFSNPQNFGRWWMK